MTAGGRLVTRYYLYQATRSAGFIYPVFTLFLLRTLSFTQVGLLGALSSAVVVLSEVPTGYVADQLGRRASLVLSVVFTVLSLAGFVVFQSFVAYAVLYVLWALAQTFVSGSADAWLYERLEEQTDPSAFTRVRGRGESVMRATSVATMLAGGVLYTLDPRFPFVASVALNALGLVVLASFPSTDRAAADGHVTATDTFRIVRKRFTRQPMLSVVLYTSLFFAVVSTGDTYIQPVARTLFERTLSSGVSGFGALPESVLLGVLYAAFTGVSAVASYHAGTLEATLGFRDALLVVSLGTAGLFLLPQWILLASLPMFVALRGSTTLLSPLVNGFLNGQIETVGRATTLSAFSMVTRLARIPLAVLAGVVGDVYGETTSVAVLGGVFLVAAAIVWGVRTVGDGKRVASRAQATQSAAGDDPE
ncbi:Major Facilitator Superfamily protein [Halogranum amylolyticum]|uniref:Major Facilitator Superfamily protein n=1 Tax=Halogranum amylolyticum TaxID=660520 RepID=A0A1H8QAZ0_9EURY|nr:MFS transporter [Halogranum amylolyticum]SEO51395.1 Major Facilitator Superfamily protein [Halogranum amylolyticum]